MFRPLKDTHHPRCQHPKGHLCYPSPHLSTFLFIFCISENLTTWSLRDSGGTVPQGVAIPRDSKGFACELPFHLQSQQSRAIACHPVYRFSCPLPSWPQGQGPSNWDSSCAPEPADPASAAPSPESTVKGLAFTALSLRLLTDLVLP